MQNINKFTEVYIFVPSITIRRKLPYMESRVKEIDYLKCIFITLMIIFHLVYIGDKYPYAKQIVYTFHMSAFLIISGYLANNRKDARSFLRKFLWIFIPYACMEAAYTVMSHFQILLREEDYIVLRRFTSSPTKGSFTTNSFSSLRISTSVPYRAYCRCRFFNPAPLLAT